MAQEASTAAVATSINSGTSTLIASTCAVITLAGILTVNPYSLNNFAWFFGAWFSFMLFFHRDDVSSFCLAFMVNSACVAMFVAVQSAAFPGSYGTTSPLSNTWTDDSYFFTLAADTFPPDLLSRPLYWEYTHIFPTLIRTITPFRIEHPLDALFFQSGTAALLAVSASRFMLRLTDDHRPAKLVFSFCTICPFLMMNGGVILLRDTFVASLLIYTLWCLNERRFLLATVAIMLQIALRPGTGLLLLPTYFIIYFQEIRAFARHHPVMAATAFATTALAIVAAAPHILEYMLTQYHLKTISFLGREIYADLRADSDANGLFLYIQDLPFAIRMFLNSAYIFLYPFLSFSVIHDSERLDLRNIAMNIIVPVYSIWLNAWFIAAALSAKTLMKRHREVVIAIVVILVLVGLYSLQSRHKTIIYPLYYLIVAIGCVRATPFARRCGYLISSVLFTIQLASALR